MMRFVLCKKMTLLFEDPSKLWGTTVLSHFRWDAP